MKEEKCASFDCTFCCAVGRLGADGEQFLRRRVHQHGRAALIGDDDRIRHRIDDQVEAVAFARTAASATRSF